MSKYAPMAEARCLHCDQTRDQIKRNKTICGTVTGYETIELDKEWPHHRWADWSDRELARFGIRPKAFDKYRRWQVTQIQYLSCDDTVGGHHISPEGDSEFGMKPGQCWACGKIPSVTPETEQEKI